MIWYEVMYSASRNIWDVYKVTENGSCYQMFKQFKTEQGAKNFAKKHWVRRWVR